MAKKNAINNITKPVYDEIMSEIKPLEVSNIEQLTDDNIDNLKVGDIVQKITGEQKHAYIVSYKQEHHGICLTYADAGYTETISYDYVEGHWVFNSKDVVSIHDDVELDQDLEVGGSVHINVDLGVDGDTNIGGNVDIVGAVDIEGELTCQFVNPTSVLVDEEVVLAGIESGSSTDVLALDSDNKVIKTTVSSGMSLYKHTIPFANYGNLVIISTKSTKIISDNSTSSVLYNQIMNNRIGNGILVLSVQAGGPIVSLAYNILALGVNGTKIVIYYIDTADGTLKNYESVFTDFTDTVEDL